jgi:hypothetical protein
MDGDYGDGTDVHEWLRTDEPAMILIADPDDPERLILRSGRRWDGFLARLRATSLDRRLAAGRSPESNRLLATRAQQLAAPETRRALAHNWERVLDRTRRTPVPRSPRLPLVRDRVIDVEGDVREMLTYLCAPLPTAARGVAMASLLLTDGTGPLFYRQRSTELRTALRQAIAQLAPSTLTGLA